MSGKKKLPLNFYAISVLVFSLSLSITFGISIGLTALSFVMERKEGLLDRTWVAGVNVTEMVLAQILTQCIILFVQSTILILLVVFAFKVSGNQFYLPVKPVCVGVYGSSYKHISS